jgi:glycosyltransferase involved in cell wall biosynthesis
MRILMLLENDFADDIRVAKEIYSLHNAGHSIVLAAVTFSGKDSSEQRDDCTVYRRAVSGFIHKASVGSLKFPFYFNFWRKYVRDILSKEPIDVIHIHDLPLAIIGLELKRSKGIKVVLDLHENYPALLEISKHTNTFFGKLLSSGKQWREYEKKCLSEADRIVAVVDEMKERITLIGTEPGKIYVVENTPLLTAGKVVQKRIQNDTLRLIYVGGLTYHRGLQYVLRGIAKIEKLPVSLKIIGSGSYYSELKSISDRMSLSGKVIFTGKLSRADAEKELSGSDIALIPHLRSEQGDNSSPNKLYEYMASGIPVLASNCRSVKRIIDETGCGTTYIYDSPDDIALKIQDLFLAREKLSHFSENGILAVNKRYNWAMTSMNLIELYYSLQTRVT